MKHKDYIEYKKNPIHKNLKCPIIKAIIKLSHHKSEM